MQHYELLLLVSGGKTETEVDTVKGRIEQILTDAGAIITRAASLGKQKLAYPIQHEHFGYYLVTEFDSEGEHLRLLRSKIALDDDILRHSIEQKKHRHVEEIERVTPPVTVATEAGAPARTVDVSASEKPRTLPPEKHAPVDLGELDKKLDELLEKAGEYGSE